MGETRQSGVDAAIGLLQLLGSRNGRLRMAEAVALLGAPRASLYRIAATLQKAGLVTLDGGVLGVGPAGPLLVEAHASMVMREDELWTQRAPRRLKRNAPARQPRLHSDVPVALSKPPRVTSRGRFRIGFSNASMDNPWRVALVHSIEHAAAALGDRVERLEIRMAGHDSARQAQDIADLAASGIDGLLVSAVEPLGVSAAVAEATARGIPVVLVDRGVSPGVPHTSFVTTDDAMIGRTTALWMAETLKGKGQVLLLPGHAEAEPAQRRLAAALALFGDFPDIEILAIEWTDWHRDKAREIVGDAIGKWGSGINGVWCDSGQQGVGSLQAFIASGRKPGEVPPHTGSDQNLAYKLAIRHRVRLAAVDYPPVMGIKAVEVLYASLRGNFVPRVVDMPSEVIITRGHGTRNVRANLLAEDHVRWDLPDDLILSTGLGPAYNPRSFRIHYPGNLYNRSAAKPLRQGDFMSVNDTAGVSALAALLAEAAAGSGISVAALAERDGIRRSTAFAVARKLEAAGLLVRHGGGVIAAGHEAVRLGFAAFGLGPLAGPAEALLTLLRDDTDGTAALVIGERTLLTVHAGWDIGTPASPSFSAPLAESGPGARTELTLTLRPMATRAVRALAQAEFERIRASLAHYLGGENA